jgi:hypothetical protein
MVPRHVRPVHLAVLMKTKTQRLHAALAQTARMRAVVALSASPAHLAGVIRTSTPRPPVWIAYQVSTGSMVNLNTILMSTVLVSQQHA